MENKKRVIETNDINTIDELEEAITLLKSWYAKELDEHKLQLFDDSKDRTGIVIREPIPYEDVDDDDDDDEDDCGCGDEYDEFGDSYAYDSEAAMRNEYIMDLITDECERMGASATVSAMTLELSWPKLLTIGDTKHTVKVDETSLTIDGAGSIGDYASNMYQLMLRAIDLLEGECSGDRIESF